MMPRRAIAWVVVCVAVVVAGTPARAAEVDLALVLAVDISSSVSEERYQLQMQGYAEAFRDPTIVQAIERGQLGAIAVTLVQWAGYNEYRQTIDWAVVHDSRAALDRLLKTPCELLAPASSAYPNILPSHPLEISDRSP
jgi:hypothetical protein